ncbi:MAG: hypothetical protein PHC92_11665 [Syntrophomonadaceae bacterium]|nr:hypothetical protein [Syntrophomonadaceae bacterium]MDD3024606.1 hypothetical protein [Syntrophomonadaceae bacterium]
MRAIFNKIECRQELNSDEYQKLMEYADELRINSADSYVLFYNRYAAILFRDYNTFLPQFSCGIDDLFDFLITNPEALTNLEKAQLNLSLFPVRLHAYLQHVINFSPAYNELQQILQFLKPQSSLLGQVPIPRLKPLVCKYEDANPYKEIGLKCHFERLGRYSFITRLQSYRYLSGNKASKDYIEYIAPDQLGGVFSNKQKSIYYYLFLSEKDSSKAKNACRLLNLLFYDLDKEY